MSPEEPNQITSCGKNGICVFQKCYKQSILISSSLCSAWDVKSLSEVTEADLLKAIKILSDDADIFILGYGKQTTVLPLHIVDWANKAGYSMEVMITTSAAKAYNLLIVENRQPAGLLLWDDNL